VSAAAPRRGTAFAVVGKIVREATRLDPAGVHLRWGLRCAVGAAIPLLLSLGFAHSLLGVAASVGAFNTGFASRQGIYRTRATAMLCTAAAMGIATLVATQAAGNAVASIVLAAAFGLAAGILASLGTAATVVGIQTLVALAVFSQFRVPLDQGALLGAMVFAGGVLQTLLLVVVWPLSGFTAERKALAAAFRALASYAEHFPKSDLQSPSPATFAALSDVLADPKPFARRGEIAAFEALLGEAERIRTSLGTLVTDRHVLDLGANAEGARAIVELGEGAAPILLRIAEALERGAAPDDWNDSWESLEARMERLDRRAPRATIDDAQAMLGQLRAAWRATEWPAAEAPETELAFEPPSLPSRLSMALQTLRANLSPRSTYAQHGVRLAATLGVATLLAHFLPLQRGYWIPLTATLVLRPDFATTYSRGVARLIGTLAGSILASLVVALLHPGAQTHFLLALAFATIAYIVFAANYALFTTAVTGYVIFLLAFGGLPEHTAMIDRIEATLAGGALALCAYAFWPTWEREIVAARLAGLIEAQRAYSRLLFGAFLEPRATDERRLHDAQLVAWRARSNAEASVDRMLNEPVAPTALTVRAALGMLAASKRLGLATLTLSARLPDPQTRPRTDLREFADGLERSLGEIATALRERRAPDALAPLREIQLAFVERVTDAADPRARALVSETDLMVDSTNTMADVLLRLHGAGDAGGDETARAEQPSA
jgi:uncharacterized membrane protein YccC